MRLLKSILPICFIFSAPTDKIYVGGKLDCYIGKLKTTASSNNNVNLAREIIEKIPEGYPMFVCYVETSSNNIFSYGYMYHSKKYGVIHIDSYFSCQAVALINGEYKLIA